MIERRDLPLRDILRFALPGLVASGYVEVVAYLYTGRFVCERAVTPVFLMLSLFLGLLSFAVSVHKRVQPWKKPWDDFLEEIRREMATILDKEELDEQVAKPVYKIWAEASESRPALQEYLQYSTGLFYSYAALTMWTLLLVLASLPVLIVSILAATPPFSLKFSSPAALRLAVAPGALVVAVAFGKRTCEFLGDLRSDTMVALRSPSVREELRRIYSGTDTDRANDG